MKAYNAYFKFLFFFFLFFILYSSFFIPCAAQTSVLYGMTDGGGFYNYGTIVSFNPASNKDSIVWSFKDGTDGGTPSADLVFNPGDGLFYGMPEGGSNYNGVIISFNPLTNAEEVVWTFGNGGDLYYPDGDLVPDINNGLLYGMTQAGGKYNKGGIFSYNPATGKESILWNLGNNGDGQYPAGAFVLDPDNGIYYGMTTGGGINDSINGGTIISFNSITNQENVVWNFGSRTDGQSPQQNNSFIYDANNGLFYGMTDGGNMGFGAIISFNPVNNTESVVWNFQGQVFLDGANPEGSLVLDEHNGLFYGTTGGGGSNDDRGTIISFNPATNQDSVVWSFGNGTDGQFPYGGLIFDTNNGLFYVMTEQGGINGKGAIISFNPSTNTENVVWNFGGPDDGKEPYGSLVLYSPNININTGAITPLTYCAGIAVSIPYTTTGTFTGGNVFTAQLSNSNGSFASPVNVGTVISTASGTISATIPSITTSGTGYRLRVVSSTPPILGSNNGNDITINIPVTSAASISSNPSGEICVGTPITFTATPTNGGTSPIYQWNKNSIDMGTNSAIYTDSSLVNGDTISCTLTSNAFCALPFIANSNIIIMAVNTIPVAPIAEAGSGATSNQITANWIASSGATTYFLDISSDNSFDTLVSGYNNLKVGNVTTYNATGLSANTTYYYRVRANDSCGTSSNSDTIIYSTSMQTGINSIMSSPCYGISVYPNPTSDKFTITGLRETQVVELYNYLGQKVSCMTSGNSIQQMDISSQANGIYLVRVFNKDGTLIGQKKVMKIE